MPTDSTAPVPPAPPDLIPEVMPSPQPRRSLLLPVLIVLLILFLGYAFSPRLTTLLPLGNKSPSPSASPTVVSRQAYPPVPDAANKLVYLRQLNPDDPIYEAWLIDPKTGEEEKLPLTNFTQAYKYYGSNELLYRPIGQEAEYRFLDLSTGMERSYQLIAHPDPAAHESANLDNHRLLSPDGKYLVFQVDFFTTCPSPSPFPTGFEGGFGPCMPDENLGTPFGYYLYDVEKQTSKYLGDFVRVSRWDTANHKLYYVSENSTKVLDLQSLAIVNLDVNSNFGYFTYPLLKNNQLVVYEGATGNTGEPTFSHVFLMDQVSKISTEIHRTGDWAGIQPFLDSSPDDQNVIYVTTKNLPGGMRHLDLVKYNLGSEASTRLTPDDDKTSFRYYGDWIDDHTFVTSVDTIEESYTNRNNYLVKIDINSATVTRLTDHDLVYSYAMQ